MKSGIIYIASSLILMAGLFGCAVHQHTEPDPGQLPRQFSQVPEQVVSPGYLDGWWVFFGDPQLSEFVAKVLAQNLDIAQGIARLAQVEATTRGAGASRLPSLFLEGQASRDSLPGPTGTVTGSNFRLSLAAAYELDLWQKHQSLRDAAGAEMQAAREDVKSLYLSVSATSADLYYLAVSLQGQVDLAGRIVESFRQTKQRVAERYRLGLVSALDLYQAEQSVNAALLARTDLEGKLAVARHGLAVLLGEFPRPGLLALKAEMPSLVASLPVGLPADLLTRRPDIQAARLRVAARDERVGAALADRFPSINLMAAYGRSGSSLGSPLSETFWNLIAGLTQPLFDGGRLRAEVDRNRAALDEALAGYRQVVLRAVREVEDALVANRQTEERLVILQEQAVVTGGALRLAEDGYFQGLNDYLPVLTAQRSFLETEKQLLEVRRQLLADRVSLVRALGGEWMEATLRERLDQSTN